MNTSLNQFIQNIDQFVKKENLFIHTPIFVFIFSQFVDIAKEMTCVKSYKTILQSFKNFQRVNKANEVQGEEIYKENFMNNQNSTINQ